MSVMRTAYVIWPIRSILAIPLFFVLWVSPVGAGDYLSASEVMAISGGSVALSWTGIWAKGGDTTRAPVLRGPLPGERAVQSIIGGRYTLGKRNFLDDNLGSIYTPLAAGAALIAVDLTRPYDDKEKMAIQDGFLFLTGIAATKGITDIAKGVFSRPRPYMALVPDNHIERHGFREDRTSFFSGHTSGAFFSAAFLNFRLRDIMRSEMDQDEYRDWRWAPPTILFGWATFVGLSRIRAYKHYLSDVLVGALAGYLVAELFFSFGDNFDTDSAASDNHPVMLRVRFSF